MKYIVYLQDINFIHFRSFSERHLITQCKLATRLSKFQFGKRHIVKSDSTRGKDMKGVHTKTNMNIPTKHVQSLNSRQNGNHDFFPKL